MQIEHKHNNNNNLLLLFTALIEVDRVMEPSEGVPLNQVFSWNGGQSQTGLFPEKGESADRCLHT